MAEVEHVMYEDGDSEGESDINHDQVSPGLEEGPSIKSLDEEAKPDRFLSETKYVVLNFMSLLPRDLYSGHLSASPESAVSDLSVGDGCDKQYHPLGNYCKSHHQLTKSKSFDISPQRRIPKLKNLSHLQAIQNIESPASEDNLNYRYKKYVHSLDQQTQNIPDDSPEVSITPEHVNHSYKSQTKSQSISSFKSESPGSISPRKTTHALGRWYSDVSSSGDFSYASDADDEGEDLSNASSIFSMRSARFRDGFLDLRKTSPRLSTVTSETDMCLDDVDGLFQYMSPLEEEETKDDCKDPENNDVRTQSTERKGENYQNQTKTPSPKHSAHYFQQHSKDSFTGRSHMHQHVLECVRHVHHTHSQPDCSQDLDDVDNGTADSIKSADRSKLKLDIPSQAVQLDDILVSLQTELNSEITDLESEFEEALRSSSSASSRRHQTMPTPLTPQSEAARILARIGDEVQGQYGNQITAAVNEVMLHQLQELTYFQFKEISKKVIDDTLPGWRQVALLMVFGQKMVWKALERGQKQFGSLIDFSAQLVADVAADFIIREGGWGAVMNFDPSQSSDSVEDQSSPSIIDYFNSHDITKVDSGDLKNGDSDVGSFSSGTNVDTGKKSGDQHGTVKLDSTNMSGELSKQESYNDSDSSPDATSKNVVENDNIDGVFNENTNENAKNLEVISDQNNFLSISGRDLKPSLGFDYRPGMSISMSEVPSAGLVCSQTDGVPDVFNYEEANDKQSNSELEMIEQEEAEKLNSSQQNHLKETNLNVLNVSEVVVEPKITDSWEQNKSESKSKIDISQCNSQSKEKTNGNKTENISVNTNTHNANDEMEENQRNQEGGNVLDGQDTAVLHSENGSHSSKDSISSVSPTNSSQNEDASGDDRHWYNDRRLGFGAVGLSLGFLALAIGIKSVK